MNNYGVYRVNLTLTDSRGTTRRIMRPCVAIDRDPRPEGHPVLLSMTTLVEERIHLSPWRRQWWFENPAFEVLTPHKFQKVTRNQAHVFSIIPALEAAPEDRSPLGITLPDEEDEVVAQLHDIPSELHSKLHVLRTGRGDILPHRKPTDHAIDLRDDCEPPYGLIYPLSQTEFAELRKFLKKMLDKGWIRPSQSPAGAPILFVPKKDGTLRLCVDFRGLNKITIKNRHSLPLISEILDRVGGCYHLSKIDVKDTYYRIRLREGDEWKTAFRTRYSHYEFLVIPMGLTNAPAMFQHYINTALQGYVDDFCIVYLDDILVFSRTRAEHMSHILQILDRLEAVDLYASPKKCSFYQSEIEFLGFLISQEGVRMDPKARGDDQGMASAKEFPRHPSIP